MTLEEAERVLLDIINIANILNFEPKSEANLKYENSTYKEAINTVINYIENESIPKEKVRELLDEQYELYNSKDQAKTDFSRMYTLEELLEK